MLKVIPKHTATEVGGIVLELVRIKPKELKI
jgi:hypothetical protein